MKRLTTFAILLALLAATTAMAAERVALPQFKSGYVRPTTEVPPPVAAKSTAAPRYT